MPEAYRLRLMCALVQDPCVSSTPSRGVSSWRGLSLSGVPHGGLRTLGRDQLSRPDRGGLAAWTAVCQV